MAQGEAGTLRATGVASGMFARLIAAENLALVAIDTLVGRVSGSCRPVGS